MSATSRAARTTLLALPVLVLLAVSVSVAQEPTPESPQSTKPVPVPSAPRAIPVSEVARETERVDTELRRLRSLMTTSDNVASARDELDALEATIGELDNVVPTLAPTQLDRARLGAARSQWLRVADKLDRTEERVGVLAQTLENGIERLQRSHAVWTKTLEVASKQDTPVAILDRIVSVSDDLLQVKAELEDRLGALLIMQDRITSERIRVTTALDLTDSVVAEMRRRVLSRSAVPLWKVSELRSEGPGVVEDLQSILGAQLAELAQFARESRDLMLLHLVLTVLLSVLLVRLGRHAQRLVEDDPALLAASRILSRPVPAALVVSLSVTAAVYPRAPAGTWELAYVAAAVPLLILARAALPPGARGTLYGLVGLFVSIHLLNLASGHALMQRVTNLVVTVLAQAVLLRMLRRAKTGTPFGDGAWWRTTMRLGRVSTLLLTVSLVANVLGYKDLARLLSLGTINSAYLALVAMASALILEGAVSVELRTTFARKLRMVRDYPRLLRRRLTGLIQALAFILWAAVTLLLFDLLDFVTTSGQALLARRWSIGSLDVSLGSIVLFVITIWISIQISRFVRFGLEEDVFPRVKLARGLPGTISMLVRYGILAVGFLVAVAAAGIDLSSFAIVAGALGVGIGFGLQNVVNNFVSGLILAFERPVQIGDTIEVGQLLGEVRKIGIRASTVRTLEGAEVIVPNGDLVSAQVTNWTLSDRRRRIQVLVGVAYGTDPEQVIDLLESVAHGHADVLDSPRPKVLFKGFGDSSLNFDLRFWTARFERWREVRSDVTVAVSAALKDAGVQIPFPQRDLHLRSVDPRAARTLDGGADEPVREEPAAEVDQGPVKS